MMWGYGYGYGPFNFIGGIIELIIWIVIIGFAVSLLRGFWSGRGSRHYRRHWGSNALDILEERYVKGEINKEEFEQKKKDLLN